MGAPRALSDVVVPQPVLDLESERDVLGLWLAPAGGAGRRGWGGRARGLPFRSSGRCRPGWSLRGCV